MLPLPHLYIFFEGVYSDLLPIFKFGLLVFLLSFKSVLSFIGYVTWKYVLPLCGLFFHSLNSFFHRTSYLLTAFQALVDQSGLGKVCGQPSKQALLLQVFSQKVNLAYTIKCKMKPSFKSQIVSNQQNSSVWIPNAVTHTFPFHLCLLTSTLGCTHNFSVSHFLLLWSFCASADCSSWPWLVYWAILILLSTCDCPPIFGFSCLFTGFGFVDNSSFCPTLMPNT